MAHPLGASCPNFKNSLFTTQASDKRRQIQNYSVVSAYIIPESNRSALLFGFKPTLQEQNSRTPIPQGNPAH